MSQGCPVSPQELRNAAAYCNRMNPGLAHKLRAAADWLEKPAPAAATCGDCGVILPCKPYEHREGCSNAASEPTRCPECDHAEHSGKKCLQVLRVGKPGEDVFCLCPASEPTRAAEGQEKQANEVIAELIDWVNSRIEAEVTHRPDINVHKRTLSETWNQVRRKLDTFALKTPALPTAQARSFSDAHISRAVEVYCKVLDEDRGGTGAYLHMGTSGAMRAALESLGVDARDTVQARPVTREQVIELIRLARIYRKHDAFINHLRELGIEVSK